MKLFAVQDVVEALGQNGFRVTQNGIGYFVYRREGSTAGPIVIVNGLDKIPESYLRHVLPKMDFDIEQFLGSLRGVEQSGHIESAVDAKPNISDSPRVKAILEQTEGTPLDLSNLTEEEIKALARGTRGMWADHPEIKDSVEWVRDLREGRYREGIK
jgi:hypothetical protein